MESHPSSAAKHALLVFGHINDAEGHLSAIAQNRLDKAIELFTERNGQSLLILGGGQGERFNTTDKPHAQYASDYLIAHGIPADKICKEYADSSNTLGEANAFKQILDRQQITNVTCVSTDLHIPRIRVMVQSLFTDKPYTLSFIGAKPQLSAEDHRAYAESEAQKMEKLHAATKLVSNGRSTAH